MSDLRERIYQRTGFSNVELDAVMAVVGPLVAAEAKFDERLSDLQAEYVKREQAWDRTRELLTRERDQARQVARQANNNCADFAEVLGLPRDAYGDEMIKAVDRLRWLHAEAVWQRDQLQVERDDLDQELDAERITKPTMARIQRADEAAAIRRIADERQQWAAAIAETAVRLSDAGYHGQLVDSVTRLIAERAALSDMLRGMARRAVRRGREADGAAAVTAALRASAVVLPESWVGNLWNALATRIDDLDNLNDAYEAVKVLIESWRPATVEAAPTTGIALADELWPPVDQEALTDVIRGSHDWMFPGMDHTSLTKCVVDADEMRGRCPARSLRHPRAGRCLMCRVEDCDPWDVVTETRPCAHKEHCCTECWRTIQPGETYLRIKGHCGGRWEEHKICQHCDAASDIMSVMCRGWPLGDLLDELVEHWREGYCSIPYGRLIARMRLKWHDGRDDVPTGCRELATALMGDGETA